MGKRSSKEEIIDASPQLTDKGKEEIYLYHLRRMAEERVDENLSPLTNLYNLRTFYYLCGEMMKKNTDDTFGMIVMDITQFKAFNEFCGRSEGDKVLVQIADFFRDYEKKRPKTYVCHIRADNFCLCTAYETERELANIALDIKQKIDNLPLNYKVMPSFGIYAGTDKQPSISYMKDCATIAMDSIKGKFYASYAFFQDEMRRQMMREKQVENDIVEALERQEIVPYIQPKVDMRTGRIIGGEALVRWRHPEKGVICPGEFIPVLEKNGFIIPVDESIWGQVYAFLRKLQDESRPLVPISINVSRMHVYDANLCETLLDLKQQYGIDASYTPLELTESVFLTNEEGMFRRMKLLRSRGFAISMDDFGTGCSTMNMLKTQPVDEVKMDRTFIMDLENEKSRIILECNIDMLQRLQTNIMIEGVETEEQREFLLQCGCTAAQGFLFYRPMPLEEFDALLRIQEELDAEEMREAKEAALAQEQEVDADTVENEEAEAAEPKETAGEERPAKESSPEKAADSEEAVKDESPVEKNDSEETIVEKNPAGKNKGGRKGGAKTTGRKNGAAKVSETADAE